MLIRKVIHDNGGNFQSNLTAGMKNLIASSLDNLSKREKDVRRAVHIAIKEITNDLSISNQFNTAISEIMKLTNFEGEAIYLPDRPQEVKHAICSSNKARKLLDYGTKVSLEKGILSMVEYINERGLSRFNRHIPVEIISDLTPKTWISDRMNLR